MLVGAAALSSWSITSSSAATTGSTLRYLGLTLDTHRPSSWLGALAVTLIGFAAFEFVRRRFALEWGRIQGEIEARRCALQGGRVTRRPTPSS